MATIHQFTQYLFAQNHQANAARFAWFNFCKNHCEGSALFDVNCVNRFISRSLSHPHWQANRAHLAVEINNSLETFLYKKGTSSDRQFFQIENLIDVNTIQIVAIENANELNHTIKRFVSREFVKEAQLKVVSDGKKQSFAIKSFADKSLQVQCFDNIMLIKNGELVPLNQDQYLFYDENLELSTRFVHHISIAPYTTVRFVVNNQSDSRLSGSLIKDHTFQKYDVFTAQLLKTLPRVFYPIKRIEQYFIDPKSEPYYIELQTTLERTLLLLKGNHPDGYNLGKNAIEKGKMAIESLYPSDKSLLSLVRDLESILNRMYGPKLEHIVNNTDSKRSLWENSNRQTKYDLTDSSLIAGSAADVPQID